MRSMTYVPYRHAEHDLRSLVCVDPTAALPEYFRVCFCLPNRDPGRVYTDLVLNRLKVPIIPYRHAADIRYD